MYACVLTLYMYVCICMHVCVCVYKHIYISLILFWISFAILLIPSLNEFNKTCHCPLAWELQLKHFETCTSFSSSFISLIKRLWREMKNMCSSTAVVFRRGRDSCHSGWDSYLRRTRQSHGWQGAVGEADIKTYDDSQLKQGWGEQQREPGGSGCWKKGLEVFLMPKQCFWKWGLDSRPVLHWVLLILFMVEKHPVSYLRVIQSFPSKSLPLQPMSESRQ